MRLAAFCIISCSVLFSCNREKRTGAPPADIAVDSVESFFPVTSFIRGEIEQIKVTGITPIRRIYSGEKVVDSGWVKQADYLIAFSEFLNPVIDTANLQDIFRQKKFFDQTVNAVTFTAEPKAALPDSISLQRWDVYVNPETGKVTRTFMQKKAAPDEVKQLTWQTGKWCRIITIKNDKGSPRIIRDEKISWSFDEE